MAPGRTGITNPRGLSIASALGRLRLAVSVCCWIIGAALCAQVVIWSLATYTDMRFSVQEEPVVVEEVPQVVVAESPRQQRIRQARESEMGIDLGRTPVTDQPEPQRVLSATDSLFAGAYDLAAGIGRYAMLAVLPLMMVGVMLAAGSATPGVERVVSALVWALVAAALILPLGGAFTLPWAGGALSTYEQMTSSVDLVQAGNEPASESSPGGSSSSLVMHSRYGLLPVACIIGITLVGLRFCSGVEAGIIAGESMRLDPVLEREAANISPSSLHSGRATGALTQTMKAEDEPAIPTARAVSPGQSPERLI